MGVDPQISFLSFIGVELWAEMGFSDIHFEDDVTQAVHPNLVMVAFFSYVEGHLRNETK